MSDLELYDFDKMVEKIVNTVSKPQPMMMSKDTFKRLVEMLHTYEYKGFDIVNRMDTFWEIKKLNKVFKSKEKAAAYIDEFTSSETYKALYE